MLQHESHRHLAERDAEWGETEREQADEITLFDLWAILVRRRWLIAVVTAGAIALAVAYGTVRPRSFTYTTTVDIGQIPSNGQLQVIESPDVVAARISQAYIPLAVQAVSGERKLGWVPRITTSVPQGGDVITLSAEGPEAHQSVYEDVLQRVVDRVVHDHKARLDAARSDLESRREEAKSQLQALQTSSQQLQRSLQSVDHRQEAVQAQLKAAENELEGLQAQRGQLLGRGNGAGDSGLLISLNQGIAGFRDDITQLQGILQVNLPQERDRLQNDLLQNATRQASQQSTLARIGNQLDQLQPTRGVGGPRRSLRPTGFGWAVIAVLGAVLGIMLGVFGAFLAEFIVRANAHIHINKEKGVP